jgi:hypothetical protein
MLRRFSQKTVEPITPPVQLFLERNHQSTGARLFHPSFVERAVLRIQIAALLEASGGIASADELAAQLLAAHGSVRGDETERAGLALAALRAAVELEASVGTPRFAAFMVMEHGWGRSSRAKASD